MIHLKTPSEIDTIGVGGRIIGELFQKLPPVLNPGVTTAEIDRFCEDFIRSHEGAVPAFQGLYGFPGSVCVSVDEEIVHGIPSKERVLPSGSIVSVDVGVKLNGWCSDSAWTFGIGEVPVEVRELLRITEQSLQNAVEATRLGNHIGDIGAAVVKTVEGTPMNIVRDLVGHGVGRSVHEDPQVPNIGRSGFGHRLQEGMVLAIEPMLSLGSPNIVTLDDGWTVITADRTFSAHFEHTVAVTSGGPKILTEALSEAGVSG